MYVTLDGSDFPSLQASQAVQFLPGGSDDVSVNFAINDDDVVECEEILRLELVSVSENLIQIDPAHGQAVVSIIDDDGLFSIY